MKAGGHGPGASVPVTAFNMANNMVGAGLLSLPWAFMKATLAGGMVALAVTGVLGLLSTLVLARCCEVTGQYSYQAWARMSLGSAVWADVVQAIVGLYALGSCITYIVLMGDFIPEALEPLHSTVWVTDRWFLLLLVSVVIVLPLSLFRNLTSLRFTSYLGLACMLYSVLLLLVWVCTHDRQGAMTTTIDTNLFDSLPILNVAWCMHYSIPKFVRETRTRRLRPFAHSAAITFSFCFALYTVTGVSGYVAFGDSLTGDVEASLPDGYAAATAARLLLAVTVITVFPLSFNAVRLSVVVVCAPLANTACMRGARRALGATGSHFLLTLVLVAVAVGVGIGCQQVEVVLSYKGALFGSCLVYLFPGWFAIALLARKPVPPVVTQPLDVLPGDNAVDTVATGDSRRRNSGALGGASVSPSGPKGHAGADGSAMHQPLLVNDDMPPDGDASTLLPPLQPQPRAGTLDATNVYFGVGVLLLVYGVFALVVGTLSAAGYKFGR